MLRLPEIERREPESLQEAADLLAEYGSEAMLVAGGTDLYPKMKRRQIQPDILIDLKQIDDIEGIERADEMVRIGGLTTLADIASNESLASTHPAVVEAVGEIATPNHRRMGTIGGNLCQDTRCYYYDQTQQWREGLDWCRKAPGPDGKADADDEIDVPCRVVPGSGRCWAIFASDSAPALIAHNAEVTLTGPDGERTIPLEELYRDNGINPLTKPDNEIVRRIDIPSDESESIESGYLKLRQRESFDFPSLGVAAVIRQGNDRVVEHIKVVLGAVSTQPIVVEDAPDVLEGEKPTSDLLEEVGNRAKRASRPMDNDDIEPAHRNEMSDVYTQRLLSELVD